MHINAQNLLVTSGQTINLINVTNVYNAITINSGGELWIRQSTINLQANARITIKPGGKLFIIESTLKTNLSGNNWEGILVEGNPSLPQSPTTNQGFTNISKSKILNAKISITTKSLDVNGNIDWSKTGGGIVIASSTEFRDCSDRHIEFMSYKNLTNNKELNNLSNFSNCQFIQTKIRYPKIFYNPSTNPLVLSTCNTPFLVSVWDVKGVAFRGCEFFATYPMDYNNQDDIVQRAFHTASGIFTYDATVIIEDIKANSPSIIPKRGNFNNLNVAVANYFSSINDDITNINNCDFGAVQMGISQNGGVSSLIYRNNFWLNNYLSTRPANSGLISLAGEKIYTDNAMSLLTAENNFTQFKYPNSYIGASVSTMWGSVYNNSDRNMSDLNIPISRYILNKNQYGLNATQTQKNNRSLEITCNQYNNGESFSTYSQINLNPQSQTSKLPFFGSCLSTKTAEDYSNIFGNIKNNEVELNNYSTVDLNWPYVVKTGAAFRPVPLATKSINMNVTNCASFSVQVTSKICTSPLPAEPNWRIGEPNFDNLKYNNLKAAIVIGKQIIADPNSTDQMKLEANANLSYDLNEVGKMRAEQILYFQYMLANDDQEADYLQLLINFLVQDNDLFSKKMLAGIYINHANYTEAANILNTIPNDNADNIAYKTLCQLQIDLANNNKNIFQLDSNQYHTVRTIAYGETASNIDAQGILALVYNEQLAKHIEKSSLVSTLENDSINSDSVNGTIIIIPNPAFNEDVTIQYVSNSNSTAKKIFIYDYSGNLITESASLNNANGSVVFSSEYFNTGLYIVLFSIDGTVVNHKLLNFIK